MWFEQLTGFKETSPKQVQENIKIEGTSLTSLVNGESYTFGRLEVPTLEELRLSTSIDQYDDQIQISEVVADVQQLHQESGNKGAMFQAASQFNLLEMVDPSVTPEKGIGIYQYDRTQGPACAIACGAGTIYRNYFADVNGQIGQTANNQIDCLSEIGKALDNEKLTLWKMQNGYALPTQEGLLQINKKIAALSPKEYDDLRAKLKIGVQWDTEVTINESGQLVSQVYCSALPVAYSHIDSMYWESFARLVLEAPYEATFHAALLNYEDTENNRLYLTLVGGGAFGNEYRWIFDALERAVLMFKKTPLDVRIVSYGQSSRQVRTFVEEV